MRIAIGIEYDGSHYKGWQFQPQLSTIQGALQNALSKIADESIQIFCAGRTDAGVHAVNQVIHFDTTIERPLKAWEFGTNTYLPQTIAVKWAQIVDDEFHARFKALSRHYRYLIDNSRLRPAIFSSKVTWHHHPLNVEKMQEGSVYLLGEQDFTSFRSSQCESKTPMRCIKQIKISSHQNLIIIDIIANAFLHHMVRNIVGVLLEIGEGKRAPFWAKEVLEARDRSKASKTADPDGLYLYNVEYPAIYSFPQNIILI